MTLVPNEFDNADLLYPLLVLQMIDKGRAGRGKHNLNAELKSGTLAALSKYTVYTLPAVRTATEIQPKHFCPLLNPGPSSGLAMSVARPSRSSQNPLQDDI
jgi:hypothetical protein